MNGIEFAIDIQGRDSVTSLLTGLQRQVPFAMSVAINRTAEEVLAEGRREIRENFIVRVPRFDLPPVQLPAAWRATVARPIATVDLGDDDGGSNGIGARRRRIFTKFEYGGTKQADDPDFPIAIPTKAIRPNPTALVPRAMYPTNLRLAPRKDADGSALAARRKGKVRTLAGHEAKQVVARADYYAALRATRGKARDKIGLQGIGGTFTMNDSQGKPLGVFQRIGTGHRAYRMIWAFRQRIAIPRRMDFARRGTAIINERFGVNFDGALALAIRTAR